MAKTYPQMDADGRRWTQIKNSMNIKGKSWQKHT